MHPDEVLDRFLRQQRELGVRDVILDAPDKAQALRARLGARSSPGRATARPSATPSPGSRPVAHRAAPVDRVAPTVASDAGPAMRVRESPAADAASADWRSALRAAGAGPPTAADPPVPPPAPAARPAPEPIPDGGGIVVGSAGADLFGGPLAAATSLGDIATLVAACQACPLHATALNPVPGQGNPRAQLVCVGEAPGQTEDETGLPFVGRAGDLLTKILESVELRREDVFICNVIKHRPPGNRNPSPEEIAACRPFLMRQLELVRPRVILALGKFAAQTLLETKLEVGKLRERVHTFYGIPLVVTYHPAALLRNPGWKRPTWEDVKLVRRLLDRNADGA